MGNRYLSKFSRKNNRIHMDKHWLYGKILIFSYTMLFSFPIIHCISLDKEETFPKEITRKKSSEYLSAENELQDVTEQIDINLLEKQIATYEKKPNTDFIIRLKLGILYHEAALIYKNPTGFSDKSFTILTNLSKEQNLPNEFLPFLYSYKASARSLQGRDRNSIGFVRDAFWILDDLTKKTGEDTAISLFIRASIAENLPWIFGRTSQAKEDLELIVKKREANTDYCSDRMLSFVYYGLAKQYPKKSKKAKKFLQLSIDLDEKENGAKPLAIKLRNEIEISSIE